MTELKDQNEESAELKQKDDGLQGFDKEEEEWIKQQRARKKKRKAGGGGGDLSGDAGYVP